MVKKSERQELQLMSDRQMKVVKADTMIQRGRHDLSVREQRCVLYAISKIKPEDDIFQEYVFELKDFYVLCGLKDESYTELKEILMGLKQKSWWMETAPGEESTVSWFNKVRTNKGTGKATIRFDDDMMPYLLEISKDQFYTQYELQYILLMKSQYSQRLYELLKSYQKNNKEWFFDIDKFKKKMGCPDYDFFDLKRYVLNPAIKEINEYSDIKIGYDTEKEGRRFTRITFFMASKKDNELLETQKLIKEELDGQMNIDEIIEEYNNSPRAKFFRENK